MIEAARRVGVDAAALALAGALLVPFASLWEGWSAVGFVALVPWLWALERGRSARRALAVGTALSLVFAVAVLGWFPGVAARYTGYSPATTWLVWLALSPLLEPQPIAFAVVRWLVRPAKGASAGTVAVGWVAPLLAWVGVEWAAPRLLPDTLGYGVHGAVAIRQLADVAGVRGLTLLLLVGNVLVLATVRALLDESAMWRRRIARAATPAGVLAALVAAAWAYGTYRLRTLERDAGPPLSVAIVQANLTDYAGLRRELGTYDAAQAILDSHFALSEQASSAELVVWPETVYPTTFGAPKSVEGAELDDRIRAFVSRRRVPLIFGAYDADASGEYNAAALLVPRGAMVEHARYRKVHPFPLSEWVPEVIDSSALRERLPWAGTWRPGERAGIWNARTRSRDVRVAPILCYDAAFTSHAVEAARAGAQLLVTLSNDSWFSGTRAPELHLVVSAFRSIETRLPQVRAANSGVSAFIDATGEIRARTAFNTRAVLAEEISTRAGSPTLVIRLGDWLGPVSLAAAALAVLIGALRRRGRP